VKNCQDERLAVQALDLLSPSTQRDRSMSAEALASVGAKPLVHSAGFASVSNAIGVLSWMIMWIQSSKLFFFATLIALTVPAFAQQRAAPKPQDTEVWEPVPKIVTPGVSNAAPPSDAIVLFDGKNVDQWVSAQDNSPAKWIVADGVLTVSKAAGVGNIETKRAFGTISSTLSGFFLDAMTLA
jgi:hypothetical protein